MTRERVLLISFSPIAADARVLKQVRRFADEYELFTLGYGPAPDGVAGHFQVPDEFPVWRYDRRAVALRRYERAYWSNAAIAWSVRALQGSRWDAVLANDVDAVGLALSLDVRAGVHADLHEYAPRQKEDLLRWRLFVGPFISWMCRRFVTRAASVTTVGQGIAEEYAAKYGITARVVTNAAPYSALVPGEVQRPIRLVHSGAALRDRNISAILDAVEATSAPVELALYLTPNDPGFLAELRSRAERSGRITLHDPVPYDELSRTLNAHDVGIHILPPVNFNNRWALPNKFFDYVQARLGVIIGPSPEMARVLEQHGFGAVAAGFSAGDLAGVLDRLDPATVTGWKRAADAAAPALSSEAQVEIWADALSSLLDAPR
ncbi:glycosyltransferase family 1 protein [Agromyces sp. NPDC060279]|uniref:glycosyltransferase family 1 protein n=1 Tax=Agromyces sp. NPDC060279 TaxID=3347092 RepID=UPI00364F8592